MTPAEMENALRRAFVVQKAESFAITSRRQKITIQIAEYGMYQGWLTGEWDRSDEQNSTFIVRLTDAGRKHFGLEGK